MSNKKKPARTGISTKLQVLMILIALIVFVVLGVVIYANSLATNRVNADDTTMVEVTIPSGATTSEISELLKDAGVVTSASGFRFYTSLQGLDGQYQAGAYAVSPSLSMEEIGEMLKEGKTSDITFTIPEGYTEYDIAARLAKLGIVNEDEFIESLESGTFRSQYSFLKNAQKGAHNLEGYLFPSTYTIPTGADNDFIISTMLDQFDQMFTSEYKKRAKKLGYSQKEIIVIASIIEKEAAVDEDRDKVASVIYNRLDDGMALQMDSTVQYVLGLDDNRKTDLSIDDTQIESEYNTYTNTGLPPGPICCPGEASIRAALYPAKTKYMYFILSDKLDDTMAFSEDYDQFLKDKDAYYEARDGK